MSAAEGRTANNANARVLCVAARARHAAAVPPVVVKQTCARKRGNNDSDERREAQREERTETRTADGASLSMKCVAAQARRAAAVSLVVMK